MKYLASFRTTLKASRYMFRALALVLWLLIAFSSVFTSLMRCISENRKFVREFNLSSDQAQRFIQRTSDVMKELKYIAENRLSAENGVLSRVDEKRRRMCLRLSRCLPTPIVPQ